MFFSSNVLVWRRSDVTETDVDVDVGAWHQMGLKRNHDCDVSSCMVHIQFRGVHHFFLKRNSNKSIFFNHLHQWSWHHGNFLVASLQTRFQTKNSYSLILFGLLFIFQMRISEYISVIYRCFLWISVFRFQYILQFSPEINL